MKQILDDNQELPASLYSLGRALISGFDDPPSPIFRQIVSPRFMAIPELASNDLVSQSGRRMLAAASLTEGFLHAAATSLDRTSGALIVGDRDSATKQTFAFQNYSRKAAEFARISSETKRSYLTSLRASGFEDFNLSDADIEAFQNTLRFSGFPEDELILLRQAGTTEEVIEELRQSLLRIDKGSVNRSLLGRLEESIQPDLLVAGMAGGAGNGITDEASELVLGSLDVRVLEALL